MVIDDTHYANSAALLSIRANNEVVLSSKDDGSWCGRNTLREIESDHVIDPFPGLSTGNICIDNYGNGPL
jgi:hypothetical protein